MWILDMELMREGSDKVRDSRGCADVGGGGGRNGVGEEKGGMGWGRRKRGRGTSKRNRGEERRTWRARVKGNRGQGDKEERGK